MLNSNSYKQLYEDYKKIKKPMKIITIIRNRVDRLKSSFFEHFHSCEIICQKKLETETTIMKDNMNNLLDLFSNYICTKDYIHNHESIDEILDIFNLNFNDFKYNHDFKYFKYNHNFLEIYVLDFNKINNPKYLSNVLDIKINKVISENLSNNKIYSDRYKEFKKQKISKDILDKINSNQLINHILEKFKD